MAEALAVLGAVAAAAQFAEVSAKVLIKTIRIVKDLREVPSKLSRLLDEVEASTSHVESLCFGILQDGSDICQQLQSPQCLEGLEQTITALYKAMEDVNMFLIPMAEFREGSPAQGRRIARMWKSVVSLKMEKELPEKLERINRLNINVVRELSAVGLQIQMTTNTLVAVNNEISLRGFEDLTRQLTALSTDVKHLRLTVAQGQYESKLTDSCSTKPDFMFTARDAFSARREPTTETSSLAESQRTLVPRTVNSVASERRRQQLQRHLRQGLFPSLKHEPQGGVIDGQLDLVLLTIKTYYSKGHFDAEPVLLRPRFWKDCSNSIYFFKIADLPKARKLLQHTAAVHSEDIFTEGAATVLIEILSTLSPVNTAANPDVRKTLLLYLHSLAVKQLPRASPILVVLSRLHEGMDSKDWSLVALEYIVDRLCAILEPTNQLRLHSQKRLIALLRRSRDYKKALTVCNQAMEDIRGALGPGSLEERKLARMLEHIYIDQGDWVSALSICFDIVDQPVEEAFGANPDPQCHDECAVWTMEDIAKIYESNGNLVMAITWLKQARISGGICWGPDVWLEHIHDKLMELLQRSGKQDEVDLWSTAFGPASTDAPEMAVTP